MDGMCMIPDILVILPEEKFIHPEKLVKYLSIISRKYYVCVRHVKRRVYRIGETVLTLPLNNIMIVYVAE